MGHSHYTTEEIARRGKERYEQQLRARLEPDNIGKYLVIDIETGEYELDADGAEASLRAYRKHPDGARYGLRIGHASWGRIGSGVTESAR